MRPQPARPGTPFVPAILLAGCLALLAFADPACAAELQQAQSVPEVQPEKADRKPTWPTFLLLAGEEGKIYDVPLGTNAKEIKELVEKYRVNETARVLGIRQTVTELGEGSKKVNSYFLAKYPVTNEQYLRYVQATGARFPFHWWKFGKKEHFQETLPKARKAFPKLSGQQAGLAPIFYWEQFWKQEKIPYAIPSGEEKHPVIFVDHRDALRFAAWAGMRLPTEAEWMLAATGGERKQFIFGKEYDRKIAEQLKMVGTRQQILKPVGALGKLAQGPFGHLDMCGNVWEWTQDQGYEPQVDAKRNAREFRLLKRDRKFAERLKNFTPNFKQEKCIAKGGSFLSFVYSDALQLRPNFRVGLSREQTLESVGFRVAKTRRPAYDMSVSRLRSDRPIYLHTDPDFDRQVGVEAYTLEAGGELIKGYNALSIIPLNYLAMEKQSSLSGLREGAKAEPLPICVVITTQETSTGGLKPGVYTVHLRGSGITKNLQKALKDATRYYREKAKAKQIAESKGKGDTFTFKKKPGRWSQLMRKHGYTEEELTEGTVSSLSKFVYVKHSGEALPHDAKPEDKKFRVDTQKAQLLFRNHKGLWVSAVPTTMRVSAVKTHDNKPNSLIPVGGKPGSYEVQIAVPTNIKQRKKAGRLGKVVPFKFHIELKKAIQ